MVQEPWIWTNSLIIKNKKKTCQQAIGPPLGSTNQAQQYTLGLDGGTNYEFTPLNSQIKDYIQGYFGYFIIKIIMK